MYKRTSFSARPWQPQGSPDAGIAFSQPLQAPWAFDIPWALRSTPDFPHPAWCKEPPYRIWYMRICLVQLPFVVNLLLLLFLFGLKSHRLTTTDQSPISAFRYNELDSALLAEVPLASGVCHVTYLLSTPVGSNQSQMSWAHRPGRLRNARKNSLSNQQQWHSLSFTTKLC